jgi:hypothetical protein
MEMHPSDIYDGMEGRFIGGLMMKKFYARRRRYSMLERRWNGRGSLRRIMHYDNMI